MTKNVTVHLPDNKKNLVGKNIKEIRLSKNLSQAKLAELVKQYNSALDQKAISAIELGTRRVPDYEVVAFANVLDVSVQDLYGKAYK